MEQEQEWLRILAVERAKAGEDHRVIWTSLRQSRSWFYKWLQRAREGGKDWFRDRPPGTDDPANRSPGEIENIVCFVRQQLYNREGFHGAQAILWELKDQSVTPLPSLSTIDRILRRNDLTHKRTGRYRPKGVPYPTPKAERPNDIHQADFIGPRFLKVGERTRRFYVLNAVDIATGRCAIQALTEGKGGMDAAFWAIWRRLGVPRTLQVDNEMTFHGSPLYPRTPGPLPRLCLPMGIEPLFIPVREPWRNGVVEKFQDYWDQHVWRKGPVRDWRDLHRRNMAMERRHNREWRYSKLGGKTPLAMLAASNATLRFPVERTAPATSSTCLESGRYHLIRFIRGDGTLDVFGEKFDVDPDLRYEYVQVTVDVAKQHLYLHHDGEQVDDWKYETK
jgi:Integrase core domain.